MGKSSDTGDGGEGNQRKSQVDQFLASISLEEPEGHASLRDLIDRHSSMQETSASALLRLAGRETVHESLDFRSASHALAIENEKFRLKSPIKVSADLEEEAERQLFD